MSYSFHPEAEQEFFHAVDYYEECKQGLGLEFALEVYSTIDRIQTYPKAWPVLEGEVRRCLTPRFPFGVLYAEHEKDIYILAVMHLQREPVYWKQRLG